MPRTERKTRINGHEYLMIPPGSDATLDFGLELAAMLGGPAGEAIKAALFSDSKSAEGAEDLDWGGVLQAAVSLPQTLIQAGGSQWFARMFEDCMVRRLVPQQGGGKPMVLKLSDPVARDEAFGDGGLAEQLEVAAWVLREIYGPFWMALSRRLGGLLGRVNEWLDTDLSEVLKNGKQPPPSSGA